MFSKRAVRTFKKKLSYRITITDDEEIKRVEKSPFYQDYKDNRGVVIGRRERKGGERGAGKV